MAGPMILHAIPNLVKAAGTSVYCAELCAELGRQGVATRIAVGERPGSDWCTVPADVRVGPFDPVPAPDVIHVHGLWLPCIHEAAAWAAGHDVPFVISPQGMLTPWTLGQKRLKKAIAMAVYQRRDLRSASLIHATADAEVEDVRRLGLRQPIVIAPFGIDLPADRGRCADSQRYRTALFVSRVHPKKGLPNLIEAWSRLKRESGGSAVVGDCGIPWHLVVAGPDEGGHMAELITQAEAAGLTVQQSATLPAGGEPPAADVVFTGPVYDAAKMDLYQAADLFVLPTHSENFGVVVLEAMACGLPILTTKGGPWGQLEDVGRRNTGSAEVNRAGWWIGIGVEPLVATLREAQRMPADALKRIGDNARWLAEERYSWQAAGRRMRLAYEWLLHGGRPPDCIQL